MVQAKKGLSTAKREEILKKWLLEKKLKFGTRQHERSFFGQLAKRLIEIMDNEPKHKVAKALRPE